MRSKRKKPKSTSSDPVELLITYFYVMQGSFDLKRKDWWGNNYNLPFQGRIN
jgi:hypothetical protein